MLEEYQLLFEEYKDIKAVNYSLLKQVADNGPYYEKDFKPSAAMDEGTIVDDLLLPSKDKIQYYYSKVEAPTASTLILANKVIDYCNEKNIGFIDLLKKDDKEDLILNIIKENNLWNSQSDDTKRSKYKDNKQFEEFVKAKIAENQGKVLITPSQWERANELVNILKFHAYTKEIFNKGLNQIAYTFTINDVRYKIRLDKLIIDEENKILKPFDVKTGGLSGNMFEINFYKLRYYLQQSLYVLGVQHMAETLFKGYKVDDFKFVYISTTDKNPYPVIYKMNESWAEKGYEGFHRGNKYYKGIKELTEEYQYYQKNGTKLPMEVAINDGIVDIPLPI